MVAVIRRESVSAKQRIDDVIKFSEIKTSFRHPLSSLEIFRFLHQFVFQGRVCFFVAGFLDACSVAAGVVAFADYSVGVFDLRHRFVGVSASAVDRPKFGTVDEAFFFGFIGYTVVLLFEPGKEIHVYRNTPLL